MFLMNIQIVGTKLFNIHIQTEFQFKIIAILLGIVIQRRHKLTKLYPELPEYQMYHHNAHVRASTHTTIHTCTGPAYCDTCSSWYAQQNECYELFSTLVNLSEFFIWPVSNFCAFFAVIVEPTRGTDRNDQQPNACFYCC